jgi:hypothetical protein
LAEVRVTIENSALGIGSIWVPLLYHIKDVMFYSRGRAIQIKSLARRFISRQTQPSYKVVVEGDDIKVEV